MVAAAAAMLRKTVRSHVPLQGMHKNVEWLIIFFYQAIEIRIQFVIAEYFLACARSRTGRPVSSFPGPQRFSAGVADVFGCEGFVRISGYLQRLMPEKPYGCEPDEKACRAAAG